MHAHTDTCILKHRSAHVQIQTHTKLCTHIHTQTCVNTAHTYMFTVNAHTEIQEYTPTQNIHGGTYTYSQPHEYTLIYTDVCSDVTDRYTHVHINSEIHGKRLQADTQHPHVCTQTPRHTNASTHTNTDVREYSRGHTSITDAQDALGRGVETPACTQTAPCARAQRGTLWRAHAHSCLPAPVPWRLAEPPSPPIHLSVDRGQRLDRGQGVGAGPAEAADADSTGRGRGRGRVTLDAWGGSAPRRAALDPAPG